MLNLVNIKIYETEYENHIPVHTERYPVIDSFLIIDSYKNLKDIFEKLFESIKYDYCDYPRQFIMFIKIKDAREQHLPWNTITGWYSEYKVNDYDDIEELTMLPSIN